MRKIFLNGIDISRFVLAIPEISIQTGDIGSVIINEIPSLQGNNTDRFWDITNPASPFFQAPNLSDFIITIEQDGKEIYDGKILSIATDNQGRTADVQMRTDFQEFVEQGIIFKSAARDTPSNIVLEILNNYQIPNDPSSFAQANQVYTANNVFLYASFTDPQYSFLQALQTIADFGVANIFTVNGVVYFNTYAQNTAASLVTLSDKVGSPCTIYSHPSVNILQKERIEGYSIEYVDGIATLNTPIRQGKQISGGQESNIRIMGVQSAVWIGETWINYLNQYQQEFIFQVPAGYGKSIPLNSKITLDYRTGDPVDVIVKSITFNNNLYHTIRGVTQ